ncbi:MAG: serine/threonine protein kinase, partial [Deltaproteobacteria bacterium]|nr:serine/threonine protein kinase [Nannocystaceae bacterium]
MRVTSGNTLEETISFPRASARDPEPIPPAAPRLTQARQAPWIARALHGAPSADIPVLSLRPGVVIPGTRYVIERWLGEGGMGVVYEARHIDIDRRVALKVLRAEYCTRASVMQAFRDEARIVSRIGSEHIAEVFDFVELPDGRLLFVMELLRGVTLSRAVLEGPFDASRAIAVLRQVCKAIAAAHAVDVVHRDLKPDNIVLGVDRGRSDFVKVLDFGIAIVMSEAGIATHAAAGTPSYLAPEVILGQPFDARVDVYAVGCTAYEMLTGRPPFDSDNVQVVLRGQLDEAPVPLGELRPDLPASLCAVVMRCLAKPRDARYPDMIELEAALCEAQIEARLHTSWDDLPLPELDPERRDALLRRMPDLPGRMRRGVGKGTWLAVAAGLALVAAVGLWGFRDRDDAVRRAPIDALSVAAYEAAARSYYVYPPPEAPQQATAFGVVIELERRSNELGGAALDEAARLREEFAATLVRLGDDYWEREGGQPFAIDYYAEALVFAPEHAHAASRAILTPGQLASLREKAETRTFSDAELVAAEPLIALADPDPAQRQQKVAALRRNRRGRAATTDENLALLAAGA